MSDDGYIHGTGEGERDESLDYETGADLSEVSRFRDRGGDAEPRPTTGGGDPTERVSNPMGRSGGLLTNLKAGVGSAFAGLRGRAANAVENTRSLVNDHLAAEAEDADTEDHEPGRGV